MDVGGEHFVGSDSSIDVPNWPGGAAYHPARDPMSRLVPSGSLFP